MKKILALIFFAVCMILVTPITGQGAVLNPSVSGIWTSIEVMENSTFCIATGNPILFMANETVANIRIALFNTEDAAETAKRTEDRIELKEVQELNKTFTATISNNLISYA